MKSIKIFALFFVFSLNINSQIVVGEYTGNGVDTQVVSGLGAKPNTLFIIPDNEGVSHPWVTTDKILEDFAGRVAYTGSSASTPAGFVTNHLSSFNNDGFTVATNSNANTIKYRYVAFNSGNVVTGKFTGSTSNQDINVGFQPSLVWVFTNGSENKHKAVIQIAGYTSNTLKFSNGEAGWGERIFTGVHVNGFSVSQVTGEYAIEDGRVYYYVAFEDDATNGFGSQDIGFGGGPDKVTTSVEPDFLFVRGTSSLGNNTYVKTKDMPASDSFIPRIDDSKKTDGVISLESDGFNVGSTGQLRPLLSFFAFKGNATLPVELLNFQGVYRHSAIELTWQTGMEINASHFLVQRSNDGIHFETIGRVEAVGNSTRVISYAYYDNNPLPGNNYYRLHQFDIDGKSEKFKPIVVNTNQQSNTFINLFPNPVYDIANIGIQSDKNEEYIIEVLDTRGRTVLQETFKTLEGFNTLQ